MSGAPATASSPRIRPFRDDDAPAAADLFRELLPEFLLTAPLLVHWIRTLPERAHGGHWVAEDARGVVAFADAELLVTRAEPGIAALWVGVAEHARGRGLGSRLWELAESHLREHGAWKLSSEMRAGDERARRFLESRGFRHSRTHRTWTLDPRDVALRELEELEATKEAEGFRVVSLGELLDRPRDLHALYAEAHADIPMDDEQGEMVYEEWLEETLRNPVLDPDASTTVLDGDRPVAFAWLLVDREGGRGDHELTGTLRAYRRRGLARLAKLAAIRWCAENGVHTLLTSNDSTNAPMLAINERLGYRPNLVREEYVKVV